MKVKDIAKELGLEVLGGENGLETEVSGAYTSDLLSDVMGNIADGNIWITLQTHKNVMAVASLREASAIILVRKYQPEPDMLEKANEEDIPVLATDLGAFEISGKLYQIFNK